MTKLKAIKSLKVAANYSLDISIFFRPDNLLNTLRQTNSAECDTTMDLLVLMPLWSASPHHVHTQIRIEGLLMQGASFDGTQLVQLGSNDDIYSEVPPFQLGWIKKDSLSVKNYHKVPLYSTTSREKKLADLSVACIEAEPWILAGLAIYVEQ